MHRINVDFPAPLGPSNPNIPVGIARLASDRARTPDGYTWETRSRRRADDAAGEAGGDAGIMGGGVEVALA
jgi:hypothetical protein